MISYMICLDSVSKVQAFVDAISGFDYSFEIVSGRYTLNAKSIMGFFSIDLTKPIELRVHAATPDAALASIIRPYLATIDNAS